MRAKADAWRPRRALGLNLGLLGSLLLHALAYVLLSWAGTMPTVDFELQLPSHLELGLTEPNPSAPTAAPPTAAPAASEDVGQASPKPKKPKPRKPKPMADAGVADASSPSEPPAASIADAGAQASDAGRPLLSAYAPPGAQIALRLHMARIRGSELADDVRMLLDAVPDWRSIVQGSGLDPLRDLERLFMASPDLQRASVVVAGQYSGGEDVPRRAVENLAAARGIKASWRMRGSIPVAPWANADETERVVALIAPQQFAITRPDDLPRVLQVARALAVRKAKAGGSTPIDPGEALLGLEPDEMLSFSVEGARLFARGNIEGVPDRLQISVRTRTDTGLDIGVTGAFDSSAAAEAARDYWDRTRERFATHPLVAFIGMREPLASARLKARGNTLAFDTAITLQQARVLIGFVRSALESSPADPNRGYPVRPPSGAPTGGPGQGHGQRPSLSPPGL
jgi:hypothetical protein